MNKQAPKTNPKSSGVKHLTCLAILLLAVALSGTVKGQSYLILPDAATNVYPITFTNPAQDVLVLYFDRSVTNAGTSAGWTITVGGVTIPMTGNPISAGSAVRITLSSPITYTDRLSVLVSYNPGAGTLELTGGLHPVFTDVQAVNNYIATTGDFTNGLYGEIPPEDICSPVLAVQVEFNMTISPRYRNSINYSLPKVWIQWDYPNAMPRTLGFFVETGGVGSGIYRAVEPYVGYPDNTDNCTWDVSIFPYLYNTGTAQPNLYVTVNQEIIQLPNYKLDNGTPIPGTGELGIDPPVDDPATLFCVGDNITAFTFEDETVFDCQLPVEPDLPNIYQRHVQWVYGTHTTAGIPNVFIDVFGTMVQVTDNNGVAISGTWHVNPDGSANAGGYTTPSGFFEGPVVTYVWDFFTRTLITPMVETYPIYHTGDFINDQVNDIFDVTLRNWGPCNEYDGTFFAYLNAVTDFSRLRLIASPPLPTSPDVNVCEGTSVTLTALRNGAPNPGELYWYDDAGLTNEVEQGTTYTPGVLPVGAHSYWVREISGLTGNCPGPAREVVVTVYEIPEQPTISRNNPDFCYNGTGSITLTADPHTPPAITRYVWYFNSAEMTGVTTNAITLSQVAESGIYTVRTIGVAPTYCESPLSGPVTVIIGNPATVDAGPASVTACSSLEYSTLGSFNGGASSATWTSSGDGTFDDVNDPTTGYTFGTNDIATGTVTLTLTTNDPPTPCPAVSDNVVITVVEGPAVYAGADVTICQTSTYTVNDATASNYGTITWTENGAGTITGGQSTLTPTYTPAAGDAGTSVRLTLTATGSAPCASIFDYKYINVEYAPGASVGPVQELCNTSSVNLAGNTSGTDLAHGELGEWTFINSLVWQETFSESPAYSTSGVQWSTSGIIPVGTTYFRTENRRMVGRDLDAEAVWTSELIDISAYTTVGISVSLQESGNLNSSDYIRVYYSIDGGIETLFTGGNRVGNFTSGTATATGLDGGSLRIIIRARNNASTEYYYFDNIIAREETGTAIPAIASSTNATSNVTGLWPGNNYFRWSVFSASNVCDSVSAIYTIRRDVSPDPAVAGPAQTFCETGSAVMAADAATNGGTGTWTLVSGAGSPGNVNDPATTMTGLDYGSNVFRWTVTSALNICPSTSATVTITRNPDPIDLSGSTTVIDNMICYNTPGQIQIAGTEADVNYYLRTGGTDGSSVHGTGGTITLTTPNLTASTTYEIHAVKDVTNCDIIFGSFTINVNNDFPQAQLHNSHNICVGTPTLISVTLTGGTGPYTIIWNDGSNHTVNNYTSGSNITAGPYGATTNISLVSVTDANSCAPANLGTPITVTVGSTPSGASITGPDVCDGTAVSVTVSVTGGVPPYDFVINGVSYIDYASGSNFAFGAQPVGAHIYNLTSVIDACGNPVLSVPYSETVNVNPIPSAAGTVNNTPSICNNGTTDIVLGSTVTGTDFTWTVSNAPAVTWSAGREPIGGTVLNGIGTSITQNLEHSGAFPTTVTYIITPYGPGSTACPGLPITRTVIVNPLGQVNDPADQTRCNGELTAMVSFSTNRSGGTTVFSWSNNNTSIGLPVSGTGNINPFNVTNTGSSPVTATITVTPTFEGCAGTPQSFTITVNPGPSITDKTAIICSGGTFTVSPVNDAVNIVPTGTTYSWGLPSVTGGITGGATGSGAANISGTLVNPTNIVQTATYTVTPVSGICTGPTFTVQVTVNPTPSITAKTATICSGGTFTVSPVNDAGNIVPSGISYSWGLPSVTGGITGGASGSGAANISGTLVNPTNIVQTATYTVTPVSGTCTGATFTVQVTVNPTPSITAKTATICSGGTFTVSPVNDAGNIVPSGTTYSWGLPSVTGGITGGATGSGAANISGTLVNPTNIVQTATYTVTPVSGTCTGATFTVQVTVNPTPAITAKTATICSGGTFTVSPVNDAGNIVPSGISYSWGLPSVTGGITGGASGSGAANISGTLVNPTNIVQTATYTVTPVSGTCTGATFTVQVTVNPTPAITAKTAIICSGGTFTVSPVNDAGNIVPSGTTYSWGLPSVTGGITGGASGSGAANISGTLVNPTNIVQTATYTVTPVSGTCTGATFTVQVTVNPTPAITAKTAIICSGGTFNVSPVNDAGNIVPSGTTYSWGLPSVTGGITGGATGSGAANISGTLVNPTNIVQTATYTITPVSGTCTGASFTVIVTVNPRPVLDPNLNRYACSGAVTALVFQVDAGSAPAATYDVISIAAQTGLVAAAGNAAPANGVADSYVANDRFTNETGSDRTVTYRVRPVFGGSCPGNTVDIIVTIRPQPVIIPGQAKTICSGVDADMEILLIPLNTPAGTTFSWNVPGMSEGLSQGTSATGVAADPAGTFHITDVFTNTGTNPITATYSVTPTSAFSCSGLPRDIVITINPEPAAPPILGPVDLCTGQKNLVYTVPLNPGSTYFWTVPASVGVKTFDFNSNAIIIDAATIAGSGTISVIERNNFGCSGPAGSIVVNVRAPSPVASVTGDGLVCALETSVYTIANTPGSVYVWSLPPGAALVGNPSGSSITVTFGTVSGSISVRETTSGGCITNHNPLPITVNPQPTGTISNSGLICSGSTHPISISLTGTTPWVVTYAINGVVQAPLNIATASYTFNATLQGNYTIVSVLDGNSCTGPGVGNATVTYYPVPSATITGSAEMCAGGTSVITISLSGVAPYTFTYAGGATPVTVTDHPTSIYTTTVSPLASTTYTLSSMSDFNSCQGTLSGSAVIIVNPRPTVTLSSTNLTCNGNNSGAINLTVASGTPLFSYLWTGPGGYSAGVEDISGLSAGTYAVVVTDSKGCSATGNTTLTQPAPLALSKSGDIVLLCSGNTNGSGSFTTSGGTAPYFYNTVVNTSGASIVTAGASVSITNAGAGTITIRVTDSNSCTAEASITVTSPAALNLSAILSQSIEGSHNINCYNGHTGTITTTVTGGVSPFIYSWTTAGGSGLTPGAVNQSGLSAGTYDLTVTDANGCVINGSWTLTQPTELTVSISADDNLIGTCSDAQLNALVSGGVMPAGGYIYSWSPAAGLSAANIQDPVAKPSSTTTYTVTVTDANGCMAVSSVTINVAPVLIAVAYANDNLIGSCPSSEAQLNVTVTGGETPYSYSWSPAATLNSAIISNPVAKPAGSTVYTVTVTDANGCLTTANVTIAVAPDPNVTASVDDNLIGTCPTSVAHLAATASGGEGPYTYLWDNESSLNSAIIFNPTAKPLGTTTYTVTLTDANGCTDQASVIVNVAPDLIVDVIADDLIIGTCPASVSHLEAIVTGGEPFASGDYTYSWSPAAGLNYANVRSPIAKPAVTTTYTVTITDRNGCTASDNVIIEVNPPLALTVTPVVYSGGYNITCNGESDGAIDLEITGGESAYVISWTGPSGFSSSSEDISLLFAGTYTVTVTDANNCSAITTAVLNEPAVLTLGKTPDVILSCYGDATASGSFTVSGGTAPYTFTVTDNTSATVTTNLTSVLFTNGGVGTITVEVVDDNGCITDATITVTEPAELQPGEIDGSHEVCYQGNPDPLNQVTPPSGGPGAIIIQWEKSTDGGASWDIISGASLASYDPPAGITETTVYRRRVISGTCDPVYSNTETITVNPLPVASIAGTALTCPGDAANVIVTITAGASPFTVVLSDGTSVANYLSGSPITVNPVLTTTYTIASVTDNYGCNVTALHANLTGSATITVRVAPEIVLQPVNVTLCEDEIATFTTDAGITTNPVYQWYYNDGAGWNIMTGENASSLTLAASSAVNGYQYQAVISGDCPVPLTSDAATLTVGEKPEIIDQPNPVTLCAGEDAVFTVDAGVTTNPVYQWYVNTGSGWTLATGIRYQGANTNTLTIVSPLELMSGYSYRVRVSGICTPYVESDIVTLTVTRQAEITQQPASLTLCEGEPATFTVNAGLTTVPSYQWQISTDGGFTWGDISGANSASFNIPFVASADNNTAYRAIISSTCGSSVTSQPAFLIVNEIPEIVTQPVGIIVCEYTVADFVVDAGTTSGVTYLWQRSTDLGLNWEDLTESSTYFGVESHNLKVNGTVRTMSGDWFRVIVSGSCTPPVTSDVVILTVNYPPLILTQPDDETICENDDASFTVAADATGISYQWFIYNGTIFEALTNGGIYSGVDTETLYLTNVPASYDNGLYRVEVMGTCPPVRASNTVRLDVSVTTSITDQPDDATVCEFMTTSFTVAADGAGLTYQWQVFTGGVWTNLGNGGIYSGVQTSTLMIFGPSRSMNGTLYRVITGSDCSPDIESAEAMLTVNTSPEFTDYPDEVRGCPGGTAVFSVAVTGAGITYQWQVNTGSGFINVYDDATYSGTDSEILTINNLDLTMNGHLVQVIVTGACMPPVTSPFAPLRVYNEPEIITEPSDEDVCDLASVTYFAQITMTGAGETTVWQVNQGSGWDDLSDNTLYQGTQTPYLIIFKATTAMDAFRYRLEIQGPCGTYHTREALLTVYEPPTAQIDLVDTLHVCGGVPIQLHGNPAGGSLVYPTHRWYGDIGPLSQYTIEDPVFNTSMAGYSRLIYQVTDSEGCIGVDTLVIEVEKPVAMFTVDNPSGCQPLTVKFTNGSSGYESLYWDFDDGGNSTETDPTHEFTNPGNLLEYRIVRLEVTSATGCTSFMENGITIYPEITSDFTLSDNPVCSGEAVLLTSLPGAFRYHWTFGDGHVETGPNVINHIYFNDTGAPVTYDVKLTAESFYGCFSETTIPLVVYPIPEAAFTADPVSQVLPNSTVTFTNTTPGTGLTWLWRFGDGNTSTGLSPVYSYTGPGNFAVTLIASNGVCPDSVTHNVSILPTQPVADFDTIPWGCMPLNVSINNTSLYATSYYWDFGDGHSSTSVNPSYTYLQAGVYQVTLTVSGPGGTDTRSRFVHVYQTPNAYFEVIPAKVYVNDERVRLFNLSQGADHFIWEFGDGDTSHIRDPFHKYTREGIYDITLHAYSSNGCYDTYVKSPAVTVEPFGDLIFATVFKPNPDGPIDIDELPTSGNAVDQFFYPPIRETVLNYHLQIFNRWGTMIFESFDINRPWNGYYKEKRCPQGVYVWLVEGKYANGRPFKKAGDITLLH